MNSREQHPEQQYVVRDSNGFIDAGPVDIKEAARIILGHDGQDWEMRRSTDAGGGFELWLGNPNAGVPCAQSPFYSPADDEDRAFSDIAADLIHAGRDNISVDTIEAYRLEIATMDADGEPEIATRMREVIGE